MRLSLVLLAKERCLVSGNPAIARPISQTFLLRWSSRRGTRGTRGTRQVSITLAPLLARHVEVERALLCGRIPQPEDLARLKQLLLLHVVILCLGALEYGLCRVGLGLSKLPT